MYTYVETSHGTHEYVQYLCIHVSVEKILNAPLDLKQSNWGAANAGKDPL